MRLKLKNKKHLKVVGILTACLLAGAFLLSSAAGFWNEYDYKILDAFFRYAVKHDSGPKPSFSPQITYLTITDNTYDYFGKNILDRKDLARINDALTGLAPEAAAYDMIFARPGPLSPTVNLQIPFKISAPYSCQSVLRFPKHLLLSNGRRPHPINGCGPIYSETL